MIDRMDEGSAAQGYAVSRLPKFTDEEIAYIKGTHDFVALNFYTATYAQWTEESDLSDLSVLVFPDNAWEDTDPPLFRVIQTYSIFVSN
jgi:beta-glucosidase/6-phospho-beta-glucosidase/beta-galactosidase